MDSVGRPLRKPAPWVTEAGCHPWMMEPLLPSPPAFLHQLLATSPVHISSVPSKFMTGAQVPHDIRDSPSHSIACSGATVYSHNEVLTFSLSAIPLSPEALVITVGFSSPYVQRNTKHCTLSNALSCGTVP